MNEDDFLELLYNITKEHGGFEKAPVTLDDFKRNLRAAPDSKNMLAAVKGLYNRAIYATINAIPRLHRHYTSTEIANVIFSIRAK